MKQFVSFGFVLFALVACEKRPSVEEVRAQEIIQLLETRSAFIQLDALEVFKQATDDATIARIKPTVDKLAASLDSTSLVTRKAGTVLYQKFGEAHPRHAEAYLFLLMDDASMADALRKASELDKPAVLAALAKEELRAQAIASNNDRPEGQKLAKSYLAKILALKTQIQAQ